jgi:hypothetical protein
MNRDLSLIFFEDFICLQVSMHMVIFSTVTARLLSLPLRVMVRRDVVFLIALTAVLEGCAMPLQKRETFRNVFNSYVHGVEVNGLFNPMERKDP